MSFQRHLVGSHTFGDPGLEVGPQHHVGTSSGPPRKVLGLGQYQENSQGKAQGPAED